MRRMEFLGWALLCISTACSGGGDDAEASSGGAGGSSGNGASSGSAGAAGTAGSGGASGSSGAAGAAGGQNPTGKVELLDEPCDAGPVPNTACKRLRVACGEAPPIGVDLRITEAAGPSSKGTIVLGTGGPGMGFYDTHGGLPRQMIDELVAAGYRVVQRAWDAPHGWMGGNDEGMLALSCRYATLLEWIDEELGSGAALCAFGNSGGAAEIAYALTHWGQGQRLTAGVMGSVGVLARLDHACLGGAEWEAECKTLVPADLECQNVTCTHSDLGRGWIDYAYAGSPCTEQNESARERFLADGYLGSDPVLSYPTTRLRFLFGSKDCSAAVTLGVLYAGAVAALENETQVVMGAGHSVPESEPGKDAVVAALLETCQ